jgi:hypothetical protein
LDGFCLEGQSRCEPSKKELRYPQNYPDTPDYPPACGKEVFKNGLFSLIFQFFVKSRSPAL